MFAVRFVELQDASATSEMSKRQRTPMIAAFIVTVALLGCSHDVTTGMHQLKAAAVTPFPQPTDSIKTYAIKRALSDRDLHLSPIQRAWVVRVSRSMNYRNLPLRVALIRGVKTPVVIYVDKPLGGGVRRGGHVLGEACQVWFDPVAARVYPASEAACSPPTPLPVE